MSTTRYIRGSGAGGATGSSWENAAPLSDLNAQIASAATGGPGGEVLIYAGDHIAAGSYPTLTAGGLDAAGRVSVRGAYHDGRPGYVYFEGTRRNPYDSDNSSTSTGVAGFVLNDGAQFLTFDHMWARNLGSGFFQTGSGVTSPLDGLIFQNIRGENVQRLIYATTNRPIKNAIIQDIWVKGFSKAALRFNSGPTGSAGSSNILIQRFYLDGDKQQGDSFSTGIVLSGPGTTGSIQGNSGFVIRDGTIKNIWDGTGNTSSDYWNGDGIAAERGDNNILIEDVSISDVDDGGIDVKSTNTRVNRVIFRNCKRSIRAWQSDFIATDCQSYAPRRRGGSGSSVHFWANDGGARWVGGLMDNDGNTVPAMVESDGTPISIEGTTVLRRGSSEALVVTGTCNLGPDVRTELY